MTTEGKKATDTSDKSNGRGAHLLTTIRRGAIAASIWRRQTATGFEYLDFSLSRSWKLKNGEKEGYSQNFFEKNEGALVEVIRDAAEFIRELDVRPEGADTGSECEPDEAFAATT